MLCWPSLLWAGGQAAVDVAGLKTEALDWLQAHVPPEDAGALPIYVGALDPELSLDEITLRIDDAPPQRYQYSDREALALQRGGLQRLTLPPGAHRLRADFAARYTKAPPDHWRAAGTLEYELAPGAQPAALELDLIPGGRLGKPQLQTHPLAVTEADPRLRYAAYLTASDRPLAALQELYRIRAQSAASAATPEFGQRLAEALDAFGLPQRAGPVDQASAADAAAQFYAGYNRGLALLQQGHDAEGEAAFEALLALDGQGEELAALRDQAAVQLGYALLREHRGAAAVPWFSRVRSTGSSTSAALLGLGWALLAPMGNGQPQAAVANGTQAALPRIPVLLQPTLTPDIAVLKRHEPYRPQTASAQEEQALRRALVPWTELIGRDPLDPAVQEGMVAIPYALNHIGAQAEALDYFKRAIRLFEALAEQLQQAQLEVAAGGLVPLLDRRAAENQGWPWWITAYPGQHWWLAADPHQPLAAPPGFYLQRLMEQDGFRGAMQDYHDLRQLEQALQPGDDTALRRRLAAAVAAQAATLSALAARGLSDAQRSTDLYLGEARFALAHLNEPLPTGARQ